MFNCLNVMACILFKTGFKSECQVESGNFHVVLLCCEPELLFLRWAMLSSPCGMILLECFLIHDRFEAMRQEVFIVLLILFRGPFIIMSQ